MVCVHAFFGGAHVRNACRVYACRILLAATRRYCVDFLVVCAPKRVHTRYPLSLLCYLYCHVLVAICTCGSQRLIGLAPQLSEFVGPGLGLCFIESIKLVIFSVLHLFWILHSHRFSVLQAAIGFPFSQI